jgi:hypothetical protein
MEGNSKMSKTQGREILSSQGLENLKISDQEVRIPQHLIQRNVSIAMEIRLRHRRVKEIQEN